MHVFTDSVVAREENKNTPERTDPKKRTRGTHSSPIRATPTKRTDSTTTYLGILNSGESNTISHWPGDFPFLATKNCRQVPRESDCPFWTAARTLPPTALAPVMAAPPTPVAIAPSVAPALMPANSEPRP